MAKPQSVLNPYRELPLIRNERVKLSSNAPFTPTYVKSNLSQSSDPVGMYASRVQGRMMVFENPVRESRAKKEREAKRELHKAEREKKKAGIVGKREAKERGLWRFNPAQAKFHLFVPLHQLWLGYMSEVLALSLPPTGSVDSPSERAMPGPAGMHAKLVKADFHGSIMTVKQSKNPCLVGLSGIVIHETENAFKVVTREDQVKLLPKQGSIFSFAVPLYSTIPTPTLSTPTALDGPHILFDLHGNQFRFRAADRAGRKFKHKESIEL